MRNMINKRGESYPISPKRFEHFQVKSLIGELIVYLQKGLNFQNYDNRLIIQQFVFRVINFVKNMVNYQNTTQKKKGKVNLP